MRTFITLTYTVAGLLAAKLASASDCHCRNNNDKARWVDKEDRSPAGVFTDNAVRPNGSMVVQAETQGQISAVISGDSDEVMTCFTNFVASQQSQQDGAWSLWSGVECTQRDSKVQFSMSSTSGNGTTTLIPGASAEVVSTE